MVWLSGLFAWAQAVGNVIEQAGLTLQVLIAMDSSRGKRAKPTNKAKSALAELAELRRTGGKRAANYEFEEEGDVYDVLDEDEYNKFAAQRRDDAGEF